jgi:hypothetical protein
MYYFTTIIEECKITTENYLNNIVGKDTIVYTSPTSSANLPVASSFSGA